MVKYKRKKSEGKIAHKKTIVDGIKFDSKMEADFYIYLKGLKKNKKIKGFELQPEFILQPKYFVYENVMYAYEEGKEEIYNEYDKLRKKYNRNNPTNKISIVNAIKYISDFKIYLNDGTIEVVDVKGIKTADFKIKEKMFNYRYINLRLTCVTWHNPSKTWLTYEEYNKIKKSKKKKKE